MSLSAEQLESYDRDGYLLIENWWSSDTIISLKGAMNALLQSSPAPATKRAVFTTKEQARTSDDYFLDSSDKVSMFYEEKAFNADGDLVWDPSKAVNKVGHNIHELMPEFKAVSFDPRLAAISLSMGLECPVIPQSMYILKEAVVGSEVSPHQDGTFLFTTPQSVVGFWWPLEACTKTNGCLWVVPGSHKTTPVSRLFKRVVPFDSEASSASPSSTSNSSSGSGGSSSGGNKTYFEPSESKPYDLAGARALEIAAGTLVILHGAVVHYSEANTSAASRHAYSIHVIDGNRTYCPENWLQRAGGAPFPELKL